VIRFPCCPTQLVLLYEVAVACAVACRDGDCRYAFHVAVVGDSETAIDRLSDDHMFQKIAQLFKCYVLHTHLFLFS
jgi:hypothetical protein